MNDFSPKSPRDKTLVSYIKQAQREINDIKQKQLLPSDDLKTYATYTEYDAGDSGTWFDRQINVTTSNRLMEVTFVFDGGGYQIVNMDVFFRINNSNVMQDPVPNPAVTAAALVRVVKQPYEEGQQRWLIGFIDNDAGSSTNTVYMKFYFNGTDTGSFSSSIVV